MTPGIGLALIAMVMFGAGDLIYKRAAAAGIEARHFIMLQAWFFCPLVTLYALIRQKLVLEPAALWGSLAGLVMFFAFYNFSRSLRSGSISTNAPIFRLSFTLTAGLAIWLLDEIADADEGCRAWLGLDRGDCARRRPAAKQHVGSKLRLADTGAGGDMWPQASATCSTRSDCWRAHRRKRC